MNTKLMTLLVLPGMQTVNIPLFYLLLGFLFGVLTMEAHIRFPMWRYQWKKAQSQRRNNHL